MKIVFFLSALQMGGAERQTLSLVELLRRRGHEVSVLVHHTSGSDALVPPDQRDQYTFLGGFRMRNPLGWIRAWNAVRRYKADVVIAVNTTPAIIMVVGKMLRNFRAAVACIYHTTVLPRGQTAEFRIFKALSPGLDSLIFVSRNQADYWAARGLRGKRNVVILNGIDQTMFQPASEQRRLQARAALGFEKEDFVVGLVATMRPEKNHEQLVQAVAALRAKGLPAKALLVGAGPMWGTVEAIVAEMDMEQHVLLVGEQSDVRPYIAAMDVGVLCSTSVETLSIAAIEMMSSELPMALSAIGGANEIVTHGMDGMVFPVGDLDALVSCLEHMRRHRAALGRAAVEKVQLRFRRETMADAYERHLSELALAQAD